MKRIPRPPPVAHIRFLRNVHHPEAGLPFERGYYKGDVRDVARFLTPDGKAGPSNEAGWWFETYVGKPGEGWENLQAQFVPGAMEIVPL